jgi:hypothetical protein
MWKLTTIVLLLPSAASASAGDAIRQRLLPAIQITPLIAESDAEVCEGA